MHRSRDSNFLQLILGEESLQRGWWGGGEGLGSKPEEQATTLPPPPSACEYPLEQRIVGTQGESSNTRAASNHLHHPSSKTSAAHHQPSTTPAAARTVAIHLHHSSSSTHPLERRLLGAQGIGDDAVGCAHHHVHRGHKPRVGEVVEDDLVLDKAIRVNG